MVMKVFSVYDSKAQAFMQPFFMPAIGQAVRAFSDLANDGQSAVSKHPEDYTLFQVGDFDDGKGILAPLTEHINLGLAASLVNPLAGSPIGRLLADSQGKAVELAGKLGKGAR